MTVIPDLANAMNTANSYNRADGATGPRIPMLLTCSEWMDNGYPAIALRINPHNVAFKQPKRVTKRNTQGGTVYMHWSDENGSNNDVLELDFSGRTGNINLRRNEQVRLSKAGAALQDVANWLTGASPEDADKYKNQGGGKLYTWARLYQLTRMPMLNRQTKRQNLFHILYRSPLFPRPILFIGFFNNVLNFTETAENPYLVEWSFNFVVQYTVPDLDGISDYLVQVLANNVQLSYEINNAIQVSQGIQDAYQSATSKNIKNG